MRLAGVLPKAKVGASGGRAGLRAAVPVLLAVHVEIDQRTDRFLQEVAVPCKGDGHKQLIARCCAWT